MGGWVGVCTHRHACGNACVSVCAHEHYGVELGAQPWWADVMPGSGPCLRAALAVVGAARKSVVI